MQALANDILGGVCILRLFGECLCFDGKHIWKNDRYVESNRSDDNQVTPPKEHRYSIFDYDIICGILKIHITDILRVYPYKYWYVEDHFHYDYELHIIPRGRGTILLDGVSFTVGPGQFYLTGPYVKHEQFADENDPMEEYAIRFEIKLSEAVSKENSGYQAELNSYRSILGASYPKAFNDELNTARTFEKMFEEVEKADIAYELKIHTLVTEILINIMRTISGSIGRSEDTIGSDAENQKRSSVIKNFVESNYDKKISIHDLTDILFLSTKQIDRISARAFGTTFHNYLQKYRYTEARRLISQTDIPLNEIAMQVGLSGESHLHKLFRKFDDNSPGSYRIKE